MNNIINLQTARHAARQTLANCKTLCRSGFHKCQVEKDGREGDFNCSTGNLNWQRGYIDTSRYAETTFSWDGYGNLDFIEGAPNHKGDTLKLKYTYDGDTHTYPSRVDNISYGIYSSASYAEGGDNSGLFYVKPLVTTVTNGNDIRYHYDSNGRTTSVLGPQEKAAGQAYTIRFGYTPYVNLDQPPFASYAKTEHADRSVNSSGQVSYKADPIDTVLFTDGTKCVLQTKKTPLSPAHPAAPRKT